MIIPIKDHIPIKYFYDYLKAIPLEMWCDRPTFYYDTQKFCWDALGLLGERIHRSTHLTKYLELCFRQVGLNIIKVIDNEEPLFQDCKNNKKRALSALEYVENNLDEETLMLILTRAKKLSDERFISE